MAAERIRGCSARSASPTGCRCLALGARTAAVRLAGTRQQRCGRHAAAPPGCVTHRPVVQSVPPFTETLILERSSAQPATFSLLLHGRFGGLQISRSDRPPGSADPSGEWAVHTSVTRDVDFKWLSALSVENRRRDFRLCQRCPSSFGRFPRRISPFLSNVESTFAINRIISNPVNLK